MERRRRCEGIRGVPKHIEDRKVFQNLHGFRICCKVCRYKADTGRLVLLQNPGTEGSGIRQYLFRFRFQYSERPDGLEQTICFKREEYEEEKSGAEMEEAVRGDWHTGVPVDEEKVRF